VHLGYSGGGAQLAVDLVNTRGWFSGTERLDGVAAARAFMEAHGENRRFTAADLPRLLALREHLRRIFLATDDAEAQRHLNALLSEYPVVPRVAASAEGSAVMFEPSADDFVHWVGANAALGIAFFIAEHGTGRLGICAASDCEDAYFDTTKNSAKRYCSNSCARLESVRAFRARKRRAS
jgi:predicted RNA-binding Zn ribbon-like protein